MYHDWVDDMTEDEETIALQPGHRQASSGMPGKRGSLAPQRCTSSLDKLLFTYHNDI